MRHQQQIADIDSICSSVEKDWSSGVISRILTEGGKENLKDTVHSALGCLIKARKVLCSNWGPVAAVSKKLIKKLHQAISWK